jgi:ParB family chromosome partitioning protein
LENAKRWRRSLTHEAQRLRDEAVEREADAAEIVRLRAEGLPVLTAEEVAEAQESGEVLRIERLVTAEGAPLPEEEWPGVPGARVQVVKEWVYPEDEYDDTDEDEATAQDDEEYEPAEPYQQYVPVWVVTDLAASGLRRRGQIRASGTGSTSDDDGESAEQAEARRQERRRVIANNKAWDSVLLTAPPKALVRGPRRKRMQWTNYDRYCSTGAGNSRGLGRFAPVQRRRCRSWSSTSTARRSNRSRCSCGT